MARKWKFAGSSVGNDELKIRGISVWSHKWISEVGELADVQDPSYGQDFKFQVYSIDDGEQKIEFAAGEFSSNAWGFYIPF